MELGPEKCLNKIFAISQLSARAVLDLMSLRFISAQYDTDLQTASALTANKWVKVLLKMAEEIVVSQ